MFAFFGFSYLTYLDNKHFSKEKVATYIENAKTFVEQLHEKLYLKEREAHKSEKNKVTTVDGEDAMQKISEDSLDDEYKVRYQRMMLTDLDMGMGDEIVADEAEIIHKKREEINRNIAQNVTEYVYWCRSMDVVADLNTFGNEDFKSEKNKLNLDLAKSQFKDHYYVYKYFDLLKWWRTVGKREFPYLATAACIVLGKPSHNGFQERVFSRGT